MIPENIDPQNQKCVLAVPPGVDPKEIMKRLNYKPSTLVWKNFQSEQPIHDKWIVLWCNLGSISPNLIITYRDTTGNYDLPHPTKSYPVQAWAYIDLPQVDDGNMELIQKELEDLAKNIPLKGLDETKPIC